MGSVSWHSRVYRFVFLLVQYCLNHLPAALNICQQVSCIVWHRSTTRNFVFLVATEHCCQVILLIYDLLIWHRLLWLHIEETRVLWSESVLQCWRLQLLVHTSACCHLSHALHELSHILIGHIIVLLCQLIQHCTDISSTECGVDSSWTSSESCLQDCASVVRKGLTVDCGGPWIYVNGAEQTPLCINCHLPTKL